MPGATSGAPRRVLVTGASEGIGLAAALAFAEEGARLAISARRAPPLLEASRRLLEAGAADVRTFALDVGTKAGVERFGREALEALGGLDVLVHNAGGGGPGGALDLGDDEFEKDWHYAFEVNVMAPARLARLAAPALRASKGVIVHVSSASAARPLPGAAASYSATKAGQDVLTRLLARDLGGDGVRVVGVAPGPVWTESWERDLARDAAARGLSQEGLRAEIEREAGASTALGRPGRPEEIGRAIRWLASPQASYLTGTVVSLDGGYLA